MHDQKLARLFDRYRSKNDLAALAEVFDAVSPELLRVARHVAGRASDPEDLVQGTFLAAIEHASTYDASRPLVPWLLGILINLSRSARRRASTNLPEEAAAAIASGTRPLDDAEANEIDDVVRSALSQLPDTYREVLVPHLSEGKKPHQIARDLGRPQGTVRAQIHRGIRLMRRTLPAGFTFGFLAMLSTSSLAGVRERVLAEAARASGRPLADALGLKAEAASRLLRRRIAAASLAVGVGIATWLAWPDRGPVHAETSVAANRSKGTTGAAGLDSDANAVARAAAVVEAPLAAVDAPAATEEFGSVLVHVTDSEGAQPIAGASVNFLAWGDPRWFERPRATRTDAEGNVRFDRVHPGRVCVRVDGGAQVRADVVARTETRIEARRDRGLAFDVRVLDEAGMPVEGAVVDLFESRGGASTATSPRTDSEGRARFENVSPYGFASARAAGHVRSPLTWLENPRYAPSGGFTVRNAGVDESRPVLEFRLRSGGVAFEGRVVDGTGRPVADARVVARAPNAAHALWAADGKASFERAPVFARSGVDGRFRLEGLGAESLSLRVEASGHAVHESTLVPHDGRFEPADVVLSRDASVHGIVTFRNGEPAAFARVTAEIEPESAPIGSDEASRATSGAVRSGAASDGAGAKRATTTHATTTHAAANTPPVAGARDVVAERNGRDGHDEASGRARVVATTTADGSFRLDGVPPGRVWLTASAGGIGPVTTTTWVLRADEDREWRPQVDSVPSISGVGFGEDGRRVKTWLVLAVPETQADGTPIDAESWLRERLIVDPATMSMQSWLDPNGRFSVPCTGDGPHRLELRPREAWQGIVLGVREHVPAGATDVELRVQRARGVVHGRVRGTDGRSIDVAAVTAVSADVAGVSRAVVDASTGHFTLEVPPGRHQILVWPRDGAPQHLASATLSGGERLDLPDLVVERTGSLRVEAVDVVVRDVELWRDHGLAFELEPVVAAGRPVRAWTASGLQPGRHHVRALDEHGKLIERDVDVTAGETARLSISEP